MTNDTVRAIPTIKAPAETVFANLADPTGHAAVNDTCWAHEPLDDEKLTAAGQIFRMQMCDDNQIPTPPDHLADSFRHLAEVVAAYPAARS